jgi:hypothetical protein
MKTKEQFVIKFDTGQYLESITDSMLILETGFDKKLAYSDIYPEIVALNNYLNHNGYTCSIERVGK